MSELADKLKVEVDRVQGILDSPEQRPRDGLSFLLTRKAVAEAKEALRIGGEERQRFYLSILQKCVGAPPSPVSRET